MFAREVIAPTVWERLTPEAQASAEFTVKLILAAGLTIMSKEDVESVRDNPLEEAAKHLE